MVLLVSIMRIIVFLIIILDILNKVIDNESLPIFCFMNSRVIRTKFVRMWCLNGKSKKN